MNLIYCNIYLHCSYSFLLHNDLKMEMDCFYICGCTFDLFLYTYLYLCGCTNNWKIKLKTAFPVHFFSDFAYCVLLSFSKLIGNFEIFTKECWLKILWNTYLQSDTLKQIRYIFRVRPTKEVVCLKRNLLR